MIQAVFRIVLAVVWLTVGVGMLVRGLLPGELFAGRDGMTLNLFGLLALALSAYNVLRLVNYIRRQQARARLTANPLTRREPGPPREREYIPELDFSDRATDGRTDEPRPPGSAS